MCGIDQSMLFVLLGLDCQVQYAKLCLDLDSHAWYWPTYMSKEWKLAFSNSSVFLNCNSIALSPTCVLCSVHP